MQQGKGPGAVTHILAIGVDRDSKYSNPFQFSKIIFQKLLSHYPGDEVPRWFQPLYIFGFYQATFKRNLNSAYNVGDVLLIIEQGSQQNENLVGGVVRQQLQIIWLILIVGL